MSRSRARSLVRWFVRQSWSIGVCDAPIHRFLDPGFVPNPTWIAEPTNGYYADPFAFGKDILCEYFDQDVRRGVITLITTTPTGVFRGGRPVVSSVVVIDEACHLSYPYPINHDGRLWCVVESHHRGALFLYEGSPDGRSWRESRLILTVPAVDPTIVRWEGRWWLFATLVDPNRKKMVDTDLYLWHSEHLFGPWVPHAQNPVKSDIRSSRPGGTPFVFEGRLYRPTQDCSRTYGGAISLMEVTRLNHDSFSERLVRWIGPLPPYTSGIHTLSSFGEKTLIDGKRYAIRGVNR